MKKLVNKCVEKITSPLNATFTKVMERIHAALGKSVTLSTKLATLLLIKYLYIFLVVMILKDQWYVGYGSYGIAFVLWKELLGSIVFLAICAVYMTINIEKTLTDTILYFLLVLSYIPVNSAFSINNQPFAFFISSNLYFLLIIVAVSCGIKLIKKAQAYSVQKGSYKTQVIQTELYNDRNVAGFCIFICCTFILYKLMYNGLSLSVSMNYEDVYGNRAVFTEYLDRISRTLFSYLFAILRNATSFVAPFYIIISLMRKKWGQVVLGLTCTLAQYAVFSGKGTLLFIPIVFGVYLCYRMHLLQYIKRVFTIGMVGLLIVCLLEHFLLKNDRVFTLIIRRMMYAPAWLNTMYYEYFTENGPVLWTQNVFLLQNILQPVYEVGPLQLISETYFGGQVPSPNTGLFAEAVMHFGMVGVLIYPVLIAIVLLIFDAIFEKYGMCIQIFVAIKLALQLQNTPMTRTDFVLSYYFCAFMLFVLPYLHLEDLPKKIKAALHFRRDA